MKLPKKVFLIVFLLVGFSIAKINASEAAISIVEVVQLAVNPEAFNSGAKSGSIIPIILSGSQLSSTFIADSTPVTTVNVSASASNPFTSTATTQAVSVRSGLQVINVGLTNNSANGYVTFNFDNTVISKIPSSVLSAGLYIAVSLSNSGGQQVATVTLCDNVGNVYASGTQTVAGGLTYANIGFNMEDTLDTVGKGQTYVNWVKIANGLPVMYQQSATTTAPIGGQTAPTAASIVAPISLSAGKQMWLDGYASLNTAPDSTPVANVSVTKPFVAMATTGAISVSSGLQFINVGLTNNSANCWVVFNFDNTVISQLPSSLLSAGLYIAVNLSNSGGKQVATVTLCDNVGNVYASGTQTVPGGLSYANIGFNMEDTSVAPSSTQTYVNWVKIANGLPVMYQQSATTTAPIGGQTAPAVAAASAIAPVVLSGSQLSSNFNPDSTSIATVAMTASPSQPFTSVAGTLSVSPSVTLINVGLTNNSNNGYVSFNFDSSVISQIPISVLNAGLYIAVNLTNSNGQQMAIVTLTDNVGTLYASGTQTVSGGISLANIGINMSDTLVTPTAGQTYINGVVLANGLPVVCMNGSTTSAPITVSQSTYNSSEGGYGGYGYGE